MATSNTLLAQQVRALQPRRQAGSLRSHQLAGTLGTLRDVPSYLGTLREGRGPAGTLRGMQREGASVLGTLREARSPGEVASPAEPLHGDGAGTQPGAAEEGLAGAGVEEEGANVGDIGTGTLRGTAGGTPGRPGEPLGAPAGDRSSVPTVVRSSCIAVTVCCVSYQLQVGKRNKVSNEPGHDCSSALRNLCYSTLHLSWGAAPSSSHKVIDLQMA